MRVKACCFAHALRAPTVPEMCMRMLATMTSLGIIREKAGGYIVDNRWVTSVQRCASSGES